MAELLMVVDGVVVVVMFVVVDGDVVTLPVVLLFVVAGVVVVVVLDGVAFCSVVVGVGVVEAVACWCVFVVVVVVVVVELGVVVVELGVMVVVVGVVVVELMFMEPGLVLGVTAMAGMPEGGEVMRLAVESPSPGIMLASWALALEWSVIICCANCFTCGSVARCAASCPSWISPLL